MRGEGEGEKGGLGLGLGLGLGRMGMSMSIREEEGARQGIDRYRIALEFGEGFVRAEIRKLGGRLTLRRSARGSGRPPASCGTPSPGTAARTAHLGGGPRPKPAWVTLPPSAQWAAPSTR